MSSGSYTDKQGNRVIFFSDSRQDFDHREEQMFQDQYLRDLEEYRRQEFNKWINAKYDPNKKFNKRIKSKFVHLGLKVNNIERDYRWLTM